MVLQSSVELAVEYSSFLSMMETREFWQRRWCCLRGHIVSYWDYPHDQTDKVISAILNRVLLFQLDVG
jgi:hypothetical protein